MRVLVLFDLPTTDKLQRKNAAAFRKILLNDGFLMLQKSVYVRYCNNRDAATKHIKRVKKHIPPDGKVLLQVLTDEQFANMKRYENGNVAKMPDIRYAEHGIEVY